MVEQLHISVSTVKRALKELIEAGYIEKTARFREKNRGQSSNLYTLIFATRASVFDDEDRIYIQSYATQEPSANYFIEHITFETLSAQAHTETRLCFTRHLYALCPCPQAGPAKENNDQNHYFSDGKLPFTVVDGGGVHFAVSLNYSG